VAKLAPITILYDTRERAGLETWLALEPAVTAERATLQTGDYSAVGLSHLVALEYKALGDLAHCCGTDRERFLVQCRRLTNYPVRALIIGRPEAEIHAEAYVSRIKGSSVAGTLMGVSVRYGIPVWFASSQKDAAKRIVWICRKVAQLQAEGFFEQEETTDGRQHVVNE
jgi:ERCC4-type nuclease